MNRFFNTSVISILLLQVFLWTSTASLSQDLDERRFTVSVRFDAGLGRNVFALDSESNTNLSIQRGSTLVFNIADESLKDHPLGLSFTEDGIHSGGTPANSTTINDNLIVAVNTDTPDQLFLYCERHKGMGKNISLAVNGSTTELFLSDFNSNSEEVYIPRIHVNGEEPRIFSLRLGLSSDRTAFNLISASEGRISEFAQPDRRQATYDSENSTVQVPALLALNKLYSASFSVESSSLKLIEFLPLSEDIMSYNSDFDPASDLEVGAGSELNPELKKKSAQSGDQYADGQPSNNWAIKYDSNY